MICPQGPDLRRSIGVVIPVLAPRFSWCLMDLTEVWGPTYILKGYTMQFPTSDKIILRAAKRLSICEAEYHSGIDPWYGAPFTWNAPDDITPMMQAYVDFLQSCSQCEIIRIVKLSSASIEYASKFMESILEGQSNFDDFDCEFEPDPRQLSLSI